MNETPSFDLNKVASNLVTHFLSTAAERAADATGTLTSKVRVQLRDGFAEYIRANLTRTSSVKTILSADEAVPLRKIYMPLTYIFGGRRLTDSQVMNDFLEHGRAIVAGTAGGGKSIFLKQLYNSLAEHPRGLLPVFFELRGLNQVGGKALFDVLFDQIKTHVQALSRQEFDIRLRDGRFPLILDGFDEINFDIRPQYTKELSEFSQFHPKARIVITTRPEEDLKSLAEFRVFRVEPMNKSQAIALLERIEYDPDVKVPFISAVRSTLYDRHRDFLSNPLLMSMMLLTYGSFSDIPDKIYIFYQQAFEVLFQRHDRSKGVFTRKSHAGLAIDEFQAAFAFFCASSYSKGRLTFSDAVIIEELREALSCTSAACQPEEFLNDLVRSTCLLHRDGTAFAFVHRSFQEYFTAVFIAKLPDDEIAGAVEAVMFKAPTDNVLMMLHGIDQGKFDRGWALGACEGLAEDMPVEQTPAESLEIIKSMFGSWGISGSGTTFFLDQQKAKGYRFYVLMRRYPEVYRDIGGLNDKSIWRTVQRLVAEDNDRYVAIQPLFGRKISIDTFFKRKKFPPLATSPTELLTEDLIEVLGLRRWILNAASATQALGVVLATQAAQKRAEARSIFAPR